MKNRRNELRKYNLSNGRSLILFAIQSLGDKATPAEISRKVLREPHGISETLIRMEKEGLIRKINDLRRKNQVRIVLTQKGIEAYNKSSIRESIHEIMSNLSDEEEQQLTSLLQKIKVIALQNLGVKIEVLT